MESSFGSGGETLFTRRGIFIKSTPRGKRREVIIGVLAVSSHETNFRGRDGEKEKQRNAALKRVLPNVVACFKKRVENDESCSASFSRSCRQVGVSVSLSLSFSFFFPSWWNKIFKSLDCRQRTYRLRNMWMIFNEILILLYHILWKGVHFFVT